MKLNLTKRLGLGVALGLGAAAVFYMIFWFSFGNMLAGSQSLLILLLSLAYPAGCGAVLLGFYTEHMILFQKMLLRTVILALGFVLWVFVWRYVVCLAGVILSGTLLKLASLVLGAGFLAGPGWIAVKLVLGRPNV